MVDYLILDKKRLDILPILTEFKGGFYLGGGTGLALQISHRRSVDFDFFSIKEFKTGEVFEKAREAFRSYLVTKIQEERGTLTLLVDGEIKISFFYYPYPLVKAFIEEPFLRLASLEDIGCMKLSAITGRATKKDYVDLFFILKKIKLIELLKYSVKKMPELDVNLILKSLAYFEDITDEPINFCSGKEISFDEIKKFLIREIKKAGFS